MGKVFNFYIYVIIHLFFSTIGNVRLAVIRVAFFLFNQVDLSSSSEEFFLQRKDI